MSLLTILAIAAAIICGVAVVFVWSLCAIAARADAAMARMLDDDSRRRS